MDPSTYSRCPVESYSNRAGVAARPSAASPYPHVAAANDAPHSLAMSRSSRESPTTRVVCRSEAVVVHARPAHLALGGVAGHP